MEFKVGDRVRYIGCVFSLKDKIGTIYYISDNYENYDIILDNWHNGHDGNANDDSNNHWWCNRDDLELIKSYEYKVGDRVLIKNKRGDGWCTNGEMDKYMGTVQKIRDIEKKVFGNYDYFYIKDDTNSYIFRTTDIEKVIKEPELEMPSTAWRINPCYIDKIEQKVTIGGIPTTPFKEENMEEEKMEIEQIYKEKAEKYLREEFRKKKEELLNNDRVKSVVERAEEELNVLLERDEDNKVSLYFSAIEPTTKALIEKAEKELDEKIDKLYDLVKEVEAQLEIAENYETKIEILKRYKILDEDGKIVDLEENKFPVTLKFGGEKVAKEIEKAKRGLRKRK